MVPLAVIGCGPPPEIGGGVPGRIRSGETPLRDVEISVYPIDEPVRLAVAVSDETGHFTLRAPDSLEAVWLAPGDYRVTIESVGEIPLVWPAALADPNSTSLRVTWPTPDDTLDLDVPRPR